MEKIELKNVMQPDGTDANMVVEVVPFDRRNDEHVDFAYAYSDMACKAPSPFKSISDASRAYARLFMAHKEEDEKNPDSVFSIVINDLRACRSLFNHEKAQMAIQSFFANA